MAMNHSAESVGPAEDQFMAAQRRRISEDRGDIQCAVIKLPEIVKQAACCGRVVESKGQGFIPSWFAFVGAPSTRDGGRHVRRLGRRHFSVNPRVTLCCERMRAMNDCLTSRHVPSDVNDCTAQRPPRRT